jgi:RNA polymerase sigma-70 factor (ECF subfamily)
MTPSGNLCRSSAYPLVNHTELRVKRTFVDDFEIIKRVQNGDVESFSLLVEKYHNHLLNFIYRIVRDEKIVEDIGQEVFLSIYRSLQSFDVRRGTPFSAWLFMSARNRCISELRKNRNKINVPMEDADGLVGRGISPEKAAIDSEQLRAIHASLEQLPEPFKTTILQSLRGESLEEMARKSGVSVGTVKSRLFRAREKLKSFLKEHFGGSGYEGV